ncbi:MAG: hypothetical protein NTW21_10150 [Verrucomicrobia bacterium]|nr:hypothetical protein [Verrucomicrobiota bacterium]
MIVKQFVASGTSITRLSRPKMADLQVNPANVSIALYPGLKIEGVVGQTYGIQANPDLANPGGWAGVANVTLTEAIQIWYDSLSTSAGKRFYRVAAGAVSIP